LRETGAAEGLTGRRRLGKENLPRLLMEEGFFTAQADTFARANVKRKSVGLLRSK
jgi:hypothetical protein